MRALADPDSKIYSILNKLTLLVELNILVFLCCLPVVTAGAALCSMHAVLLKIYRNEEKRVTGDFFRAMKENLKKGTVLWLLYLSYGALLFGMGALAKAAIPEGAIFVVYGLLLAAAMGLVLLDWVLILQSRYVYTIPESLQNAVLAWMSYPGSTLVFLVSLVIPGLLCLSIPTMPLLMLIGITLPHFISTTLYSQVFNRLEGVPDKVPEL